MTASPDFQLCGYRNRKAFPCSYGIGRKIGGDWHISRVALQIFLDG
jgi:hypothetical protein